MSEELFQDEPRWTVATRYKHQTRQERESRQPQIVSHHELLFGTDVQSKAKGEHGLENLREKARFLNKKRLVPRDRIQCAADAPSPQKYIEKYGKS